MVRALRGVAAGVGLAIFLLSVPSAGGGEPCPAGSTTDRPFNPSTDLADCQFTTAEGLVQRGYTRVYNVYCPHRLTPEQAEAVANDLALRSNASLQLRTGGSPVRDEFEAMRLQPTRPTVVHRFHYACTSGGRAGAATHIKIAVQPKVASAMDIARTCTPTTRQAGSLQQWSHARLLYSDLATTFKCTTHLLPSDGAFIEEVRDAALTRMYSQLVLSSKADICYKSHGIQCAPCTSTDTLRVSYRFVREKEPCRPGEKRYQMYETIKRCEADCDRIASSSSITVECSSTNAEIRTSCQRHVQERKKSCYEKCAASD